MTVRRLQRMLGAAAALALTLGLAACGESDAPDRVLPSSAEHNAADVEFASDMIQHHAQALAMVDLTRGRSLDPEFSALVEGIQAAQTPEIETMTTWLTEWGEEIPATVRDHVNSGHGSESGAGMDGVEHGREMPGMMTAEQMAELADLPDTADSDFGPRWLESMIAHHEGAVEMAEDHLDHGQYAAARDLAEAVVGTQKAEIRQMQAMLAD